ncbi:uncharacterized protein EAF01_000998 [Botrytis porri]|uniref:uncharacterized protein n=1 Tax=Botrytis porri TaxID=87229 RepID=UPI001901F93E|nr:uncharacterized protein EAF01_000998 [Botrytis porri]KAF7914592.1 hypothetical protein EAF01_000998 [Botrytis porri]
MNDPPPPYTSRPPSYTERTPLLHLHLPTEPRPYQTPALRSDDASRFRAATWMSIFVISLVGAFYIVLIMVVGFSIFWPKEGD